MRVAEAVEAEGLSRPVAELAADREPQARALGLARCADGMLADEGFLRAIHHVLLDVHVMRAALESAHRGWGQSIVIGVAGAGEEISTRPFQLVTGRVWKGSAFGGVKGRTELPGMVEDAMKGDIDLAPFVTHTMGLEEINEAFELMHEGKSIRSVIHY